MVTICFIIHKIFHNLRLRAYLNVFCYYITFAMLRNLEFILVCAFALVNTTCIENNRSLTVNKDTKIIGGTGVSIYEAPYQASIRLKSLERKRGYGGGHICGGAVITQRVVLTAAHCIIVSKYKLALSRSPEDLIVVLGSIFLNRRNAVNLIYNVQLIKAHDDFNATSLENDIALVFLSGHIPWNWLTVRAISINTLPVKPKTLCTVTGWGLKANGMASLVLLGAKVPIIANRYCSKSYGYLPNTMLCAGYMVGGIDACQGDSGGPLQCNNRLVGIVSWGNGCAEVNYPGVYTNVSAYQNWIVKINNTFNYSEFSRSSHLLFHFTLNFVIAIICIYSYHYW